MRVLVEDFFAGGGGGGGILNVADEAELNQMMVEYPFGPYNQMTFRPGAPAPVPGSSRPNG